MIGIIRIQRINIRSNLKFINVVGLTNVSSSHNFKNDSSKMLHSLFISGLISKSNNLIVIMDDRGKKLWLNFKMNHVQIRNH